VRVTVVSTMATQPPMVADELRRQADVFTDLVELRLEIGRDLSARPLPRERGDVRGPPLRRATTAAPRPEPDELIP
jgi:hypothetical protein